MATIAMPHIGLIGHLGPAVRLGAVLVRQGHRVLAWGPEQDRGRIEATGAAFRAHDPFLIRDHMASPQSLTAALAAHTDEFAGQMMESFLQEDVELVVHDHHIAWARVAAEFLGLPRISLHLSYPRADVYVPPFFPLDPGIAANPWRMRAIDEAVASVERSRTSIRHRWGVDIGPWYEARVNRADVTLAMTTEEIAGMPEPGEGWVYVGPLMGPRRRRSARAGRPLIYASLGTVFNFAADRYRSIIGAVANEPFDVLLTTGGGPVRPSELKPLPPNVEVREYIHDPWAVLARCDLFLTHAGAGSIHEAFLAGVPMVCLPQGADQFNWARRVEELGAGRVSAPDPEAIRAAVHSALADPRAASRAAAVGAGLAAFDGEARIAACVARILAERPPVSAPA